MGLGLATSSLAHTLLHPTTAKRKIGKNSEKKKHGRWVLLVTAGTRNFHCDLMIRLTMSLLSRWTNKWISLAKDVPNDWQWPFPILTNKSSWNSCFWWKRLRSTSLRCEGNLNAIKYEHLNIEDDETMRMWCEGWAVQMRTVFATAVLSYDGGRWRLWSPWLAHMLNACCIEKLKTFFLII